MGLIKTIVGDDAAILIFKDEGQYTVKLYEAYETQLFENKEELLAIYGDEVGFDELE